MKISKLSIFLLLCLVVSVILQWNSCNKQSQYEQMANNANDTLRISRNESGQQVATIGVLQGSVSDLQKLNASKDSALKHLQKIVDKHTIFATVLATATTINSTGVTVISGYDSVRKDSFIYVYPVYTTIGSKDSSKFKNRWQETVIIATKDSISFKSKIFNEHDIITRYNRLKWYKSRVPEISVINKNPNTETRELKSFTIAPPPNQKLLLFLGGGVTATAIIAVVKFVAVPYLKHR